MRVELTHYNGPNEKFNYVQYNGKFWNIQKRQSLIYHSNFFSGLRDLMWELTTTSSWKDINLREDLLPIQKEQTLDGQFIINGVNNTEVIRNLPLLTGLPIEELERRMLPDDRTFDELRPGEYHGSNSDFGGFIAPGESLIDVLARDNDFVMDAGFTHQNVAKPMLQIFNAWLKYSGNCYLHFYLNGKNFLSGLRGFPMFQDSPFNDGVMAPGFDISVENLDTEEKLIYAPLLPFLIHRYGFYEGNVHYRVEPQKLIEFFYN